jgi:hypothetical protein
MSRSLRPVGKDAVPLCTALSILGQGTQLTRRPTPDAKPTP